MDTPVLIVAPPPAAAQIVVTGKALPPLVSGFDAIILTKSDLQTVASQRLDDALQQIPDIQTFRRSDSGSSHPTAGGLTSRGLGGNAANRMLVIVDGVPLNDPFGGWNDWPGISIEQIGSIRIERSGGQSRWGSGALAGLVEIDSLNPGEGAAMVANARAGSRNSFQTSARATLDGRSAYLTAEGGVRGSGGFVPIVGHDRGAADIRAPYRQSNGMLRGAVRLSSEVELQGGAQAFDDRRERGLKDSANRTRGLDLSLRLVGSGAKPFQFSIYRQQRHFSSQFSAADATRTTSHLTLDQYRVSAIGWGTRGDVDVLTGPIKLRVGADVRRGSGATHEHYLYLGDAPSRDRNAGGRFLTGGGFAEAANSQGRWRWGLSGRIDRWSLKGGHLVERTINGPLLNDQAFPNRSGWQPSGRVTLSRVEDKLTVGASVYRSWRLPTLNELYRPFRVGADAVAANAALRPESLTGADVSAHFHAASEISLSASLFIDRLRGAIANVTLGEGPGVFPGVGFVAVGGIYSQRLNVHALQSHGAEVSADWRHGPWRAKIAASLVDARMKASGVAVALNGKRPAQVSAATVTVTAGWTSGERKRLGIAVRAESSRFDDDINCDRLAPYLTLDGSAEWPLTSALSVTADVENLLDSRIDAGFASDGSLERASPRTLWIGVKFTSR